MHRFIKKTSTIEKPARLPPLNALRYAGDCHTYDPATWKGKYTSRFSNCYAYIINSPIRKASSWFPQPGQFGLSFWRYLLSQIFVTRKILTEAATADGLIPHHPEHPIPAGYYLAALVLRPGFLFFGDYHWYRLDYDRLRGGFVWTHKLGQKVPTDKDRESAPMRDLSTAALGTRYNQWGGYFLVPREGLCAQNRNTTQPLPAPHAA